MKHTEVFTTNDDKLMVLTHHVSDAPGYIVISTGKYRLHVLAAHIHELTNILHRIERTYGTRKD